MTQQEFENIVSKIFKKVKDFKTDSETSYEEQLDGLKKDIDNIFELYLDGIYQFQSKDIIDEKINELENIVIETSKNFDDNYNVFLYQKAKHKLEMIKWIFKI